MPRSSRRTSPTTYLAAFLLLCFLYFYFRDDSTETKSLDPKLLNLDPVLLGYPDPNALDDFGQPVLAQPESSGIPWSGVVPIDILPKVTDARIKWGGKDPIPETTVMRHTPGFTIFDSLYAYRDTFYIVTDSPSEFPDLADVLLSSDSGKNASENATPGNIKIIGTKQAMKLFGRSASHVAGVTFISDDAKEFLEDEDHFNLEVLPGLWRVYSTLDPHVTLSGNTYLPAPSRFIFPRLASGQWRDHRKLNPLLIRSSFPSSSIETKQGWEDRASVDQAYSFDIVGLAQTAAATRNPGSQGGRALESALDVNPSPGKHWWAPIRNSVLEAVGVLRGESGVLHADGKIVVTYVVSQNRDLALEYDVHYKLSEKLRKLERDYDWEVNVVVTAKMSTYEQIQLAARSTIVLGIHSRFFSLLPYMVPNHSSTVIEFFMPGYFSSRYQVPAQAFGIEHYGIWNNTYFRSASPDRPPTRELPKLEMERMDLDVDMIIELIEERLLEPEKVSSMPVMSFLEEEEEDVKDEKEGGGIRDLPLLKGEKGVLGKGGKGVPGQGGRAG